MMVIKKTISITVLVIILFSLSSAYASNPFISGTQENKSTTKMLPHPFVQQLKEIQRNLHQNLSEKMTDFKENGNFAAVFSLILISFLYGIIHSAGPGHNKAVVASYLLARGTRLTEGIFAGAVTAFLHGTTAVASVMILHYVLRIALVSAAVDDVTRTTQIISYSLISIVGFLSLVIKVNAMYRRTGTRRTSDPYISRREDKGPFYMGVVMGLIPCPGIILLMLFALSMDMIGLGILLSFFLTLGMVVTISTIGFSVVIGKNFLLDAINWGRSLTEFIEHTIEIVSSVLITGIGILMLITVI